MSRESNERSSSTQQQKDDNIGPAHSSNCSRQLSRIARDVIRNDVLPIIQRYLETNPRNDGGKTNYKDDDEYWNILREAIDRAGTSSQCLLSPERDIFYFHEIHSSIIPSSRGQGDLHKCHISNKQFVSLYYLDKHLDNRHSHTFRNEEDTANENDKIDWVCPATDVCPKLAGGLHGCDEIAMRSQIYYGPGRQSSGIFMGTHNSNDKSMTPNDFFHHQLHHNGHNDPPPQPITPHSCHESKMMQYKEECYSMIHNCFGSLLPSTTNDNGEIDMAKYKSLSNELTSHVCDRLTCSEKIHILAGHERSHVHDMKELWEKHHDFSLGYLGWFVIIVIVSISIATATLGSNNSKRKKQRRHYFVLKNKKRKTI